MRNSAIGATAAVAVLTVLTVLTGLVAAGPAPATPAVSAGKKPAKTASVHGKARISYIESINDDIRFTIHAEQTPFTRPLPPRLPGDCPQTPGARWSSPTLPGAEPRGGQRPGWTVWSPAAGRRR